MPLFQITDKDEHTTVADVKRLWNANYAKLRKGVKCPCCKHHVQVYHRNLNKTMVKALRVFERYLTDHGVEEAHAEQVFHKTKNSSVLRGDFAKLRHFGLIERVEGGREDGNPNKGVYKMTNDGREFLEDHREVTAYYVDYLQEVHGFSSDFVAASDLLPNFDYSRDVLGK